MQTPPPKGEEKKCGDKQKHHHREGYNYKKERKGGKKIQRAQVRRPIPIFFLERDSHYSSSSSSSPSGLMTFSHPCAKNIFAFESYGFAMLYRFPVYDNSVSQCSLLSSNRVFKKEALPRGTINCDPFLTLNSFSPIFTSTLPEMT